MRPSDAFPLAAPPAKIQNAAVLEKVNEPAANNESRGRWFTTTHWSQVLSARDPGSPQAAEALEKLCRTYRGPLYSYIRRENYSPEDAEDLTQSFLARLLEKNHLARLHHREGKFRSFLLTLLKNFLADERDKARAQKRGGGQKPVFLDALSEEERYSVEPQDGTPREMLFDIQWANTILDQAYRRLREEYRQARNEELFDALKDFHSATDGPASAYAALAAKLGMTESAIAAAIHRLRKRHSRILREEVAQTVASPDELDDEIRYLIQVVSR
jgi:RNA polymerase sigma-70 factor (ECF subfamily)